MWGQLLGKAQQFFEPFSIPPNDSLAVAHGAVSRWVEEAFASLGEMRYYQHVDLKSLPSGQQLLQSTPEAGVQYVVAAVLQAGHWDRLADAVRSQAATEMQRINAHHLPGWNKVWGRRRQAQAVIHALMRRALPFQRPDFLSILNWCNSSDNLSGYFAPISYITRALERYAAQSPLDPDLRQAMKLFAERLRCTRDKEAKRCGTIVEQLCVDEGSTALADDLPATSRLPSPTPAPAGSAGILDQLKRYLGMVPEQPLPATTIIEPDRFALRDDSPLRPEHHLLSVFYSQVVGTHHYYGPQLEAFAGGRVLLALEPDIRGYAVLAAAERHINTLLSPHTDYTETAVWQSRYAATATAVRLFLSEYSLSRLGLFDLLLYLSASNIHAHATLKERAQDLISQAEQCAADSPLSEGERFVLSLYRASLIVGPVLGSPSEEVVRLSQLVGDGAVFYLVPGEAWSDAVNRDLGAVTLAQQRNWKTLLAHTLTATSARPSAKWLKTGARLVEAVNHGSFCQALHRWLPLVSQGQTLRKLGAWSGDARGAANVMHEENATCLRGLLWLIAILPNREEFVREVTAVALSAYKKVPGVGPRAVKVGNAAVYVLSELETIEAVGQLAMLKVRIKFGTAQKEIEKAFNTAADALKLPRDQIKEMGVPSYGLEENGLRRELLGDYRAELAVNGSQAELSWFDAKGKALKSVPARIKSDFKEDLKDLQQSLKDIQSMLPAQRDRIDSLFLLQKSWTMGQWGPRYLQHPLMGTIVRRLLWSLDGESALFVDGVPQDVHGNAIAHGKTSEISLWHPIGRSMEETLSWRRRLEGLGVTQPFKQAHREVYLLTDAERNTQVYSNRFAAHILRQHQFNALCAARDWRNKLRLMVDASYLPPSKDLPQWGLRAEYWVEGIGEDYGTDTNESGVFLRLATDQVRFYRTGAAENLAHAGGGGYTVNAQGPGEDNLNEPVPLEQIPPLVFSEIMRDVDLFVGVASVGNDPAWQDGGPQGRYREYWQNYSFGELSGTAATRKQVLELLVPRLKIAAQCSFSDRFLVVQGKRRTYKIHLGSGNILMEPNDQYLCIVPDGRSQARQDDLFLPFEGDNTLSIILSKALLLAEDLKIKDPTITRQIDMR